MEVFEIHITGDEKIIAAGQELGLHTIEIDLVKPDKSYLRTEFMTSHVHRCENYDACKRFVDEKVAQLLEKGIEIKRVKIECPYIYPYKYSSLYLEVHYKSDDGQLPMSKNRNKEHYLCTDREYDNANYRKFAERYSKKVYEDFILELCVYDTDVNEDKDWFDLYDNTSLVYSGQK